jgi:predicted membrane protein
MEVVLPDHAANLAVAARTGGGNVSFEIGDAMTGSNSVEATSGAGNVVVRVPDDIPVRVHATSGMGKVAVEPRFSRIDRSTYQSSDYDNAVNKVEITVKTGAGNVTVTTR